MRVFLRKTIVLAELLLAAAILSSGLIVIVRSFFILADALTYAQDRNTALYFLNSQAAEFRAGAASGEMFVAGEYSASMTSHGKTFVSRATVMPLEEKKEDPVRRLHLAVSWPCGRQEKIQDLTTFLQIRQPLSGEDEL